MTTPTVGFTITRETTEPSVASAANMSVIGLCGPATVATPYSDAAFTAAFPLDTPVLFNSTGSTAALIDPDSDVGLYLSLLNAQLTTSQSAAQVVFVRTDEGANAAETVANIVGNASTRTGIHAFRRAGALLGVIPRLIGIPGGYTTATASGVTGTTITAQGTGYTSAPTVAFSGGGGSGATATATATGGKVTGITITNPGSGYTSAPTIAFSGGAGSGATATASFGAIINPIVAALPAVLGSLYAVAYVQAPGDTRDKAVAYRSTTASGRINIVGSTVNVYDSSGDIVATDATAIPLGLHVRRDAVYDGRPFRSILNQPVYGVVAPTRDIEFSLLDGATEGQDMLAHQVAIIARGQSGNDFSIAEGGFVYLGYQNADTDTTWDQTHKVRGRDFEELLAIRTLRSYFGVYNLNTQTIRSILNVIDDTLAAAQKNGEILGRNVRFDQDANNAADLRAGQIYIDTRFEEAPVFRKATIKSRPYAIALQRTIDELLAASGAL